MKNIILLNSDFDNQIISCFILIVGVFLVLNWAWKTSKTLSSNVKINPLHIEKGIEIENYTLNFKNEIHQVNKLPLLSKMILVSLSVIIIITPLYEFIETLRPEEYIYRWSCFGF